MMTADQYQTQAARTLIDEPNPAFTNEELAIMLAALELGAAVGKVLEYVKKGICHRHEYKATELGRLIVDVSGKAIRMLDPVYPDQETAIPNYQIFGNEQMFIWCALGLGGEAGEIMSVVSNLPEGEIDNNAMVKELGDNDWYNAALCTLMGIPMSVVMERNIAKLKTRYPNGYSSADSAARVDTKEV